MLRLSDERCYGRFSLPRLHVLGVRSRLITEISLLDLTRSFRPTVIGCNDFPCEDFPLQISSPGFADRIATGETMKLEWSGGAVDSGVVLEYRHAIHPDSTVHDVAEEEIFEEDALTWYVQRSRAFN